MMSTFPAMMPTFPAIFPADNILGNPFQTFDGGFTPWEFEEPEPIFHFPPNDDQVLCPKQPHEPVISQSGSDNSTPSPIISNSGSDDDPNKKRNNSGSGSDDSNGVAKFVIDERKRRRMISNRESARRSRMRKQKHLENLRNQVNRQRLCNRDLMNRMRLISHHFELLRKDNDRLRAESVVLRQRLWDIRQVLLVRQMQQQLSSSAWSCSINVTSPNDSHQEQR